MRRGNQGDAIAHPVKEARAIDLTPAQAIGHSRRIARELAAIGILAGALFAALSLASLHPGRAGNLCGPLGALLARTLFGAFGYLSWMLVMLVVVLALGLWLHSTAAAIARGMIGGAIVFGASVTAVALWSLADTRFAGEVGFVLASALVGYVSFGGGYLVVLFAAITGLALMLQRAPTDLLAAIGGLRAKEPLPDDDQTPELTAETNGASAPVELDATALEPPRPLKIDLSGAARKNAIKLPAKPRVKGAFKLPSHSLLDVPPLEVNRVDEGLMERSAMLLEQKLADFGVAGRVVEVQPGPVVTMYKFEPASGIKVSQIVNLADDLSMALRALAVRIQAPVPGEAVVGIEVPNRKREKVYLREILEAPEFSAAQSQLTIALGKDIAGNPLAADLARMPHLLIAGATGAGKSVSIHTMLASILFNATADDVRFILIDPKMLELSVYENIPHLLVPVVVDCEKAAAALYWATQEMESRYRLMREMGVRNIDGYNQMLSEKGTLQGVLPMISRDAEPDAPPLEHRRLPKIVIVIDELADLLLNEGKSVERDITKLAQKARAAGIHLILATQRPSVDIITGIIKANLPARISFQVTSRVDSRTILDSIGAERLLGAGDMLFMPPGTAKLRRLHGPFVSEGEIHKLTDFLREQGTPDYQMDILETKTADELAAEADGERDEMYDEAVRIVTETNQASISLIQRRLRIGYNRAARIVEQMEREGLVMPADGMRPREVRSAR